MGKTWLFFLLSFAFSCLYYVFVLSLGVLYLGTAPGGMNNWDDGNLDTARFFITMAILSLEPLLASFMRKF
jgi:hypothetical protein